MSFAKSKNLLTPSFHRRVRNGVLLSIVHWNIPRWEVIDLEESISVIKMKRRASFEVIKAGYIGSN